MPVDPGADAAAAVPPVASHVFVYGTLLPGHLRWPSIRRWVVAHHDDTVAGRLYDTGHGYPAACFDEPGAVPGRVLALAAGAEVRVLALLDRIEGPDYERRLVTTGTGGRAVTYHWVGPRGALLPLDGRWPADRER